MDIKEAKTLLLADLQSRFNGVIGGGIRQANGNQFIVIFIRDAQLRRVVPSSYKGKVVKAEVKTLARAH